MKGFEAPATPPGPMPAGALIAFTVALSLATFMEA